MADERSSVIKIGDKEYELLLTTKATKEIAKKYGGLEKLGEKLQSSKDFEEAISEIVWLITLLANQPILIHNFKNKGQEKPLLTEDEVEIFTTPNDLAAFKDAITDASKEIMNQNIIQMPLEDVPLDSLCMPESKGSVRHLFLSSIEKDFFEENSYSNEHFVDANYRSADALFHKAEKMALEKGLSMVCIHNTVNPDCFDALYIPESDTIYRAVPVSDTNLDNSVSKAAQRLAQNRGFHLEIERIYHNFTDYSIINDITLSLFAECLSC